MPFLLRSREVSWVSRGGWVPPCNSACGEGGSHPSGPRAGRGMPALQLPGESMAAPGAREGKGELEAAGGQMPRTGTGRVEGGECINRK